MHSRPSSSFRRRSGSAPASTRNASRRASSDAIHAFAWYGPTARAYHAGDKTPLDVAGQIKAAMLGLYGGADGGIPNDTVEKMRDAVKAAGNGKVEVVIYPDTPHAFHADYRPSYRKEQAEDGWKRCTAWMKQHVG